MDPHSYPWPWIVATGVVAALLGYAITRLLDRRGRSTGRALIEQAKCDAEQIVARARQDAEARLKEADLRAKDELFQARATHAQETDRAKAELRDQERRLEKREDDLEQRQQALRKKDRQLEHHQKRLAERKEQLEQKSKEAEALVAEQQRKLHEVSGLSRAEAEAAVLGRVEAALASEVAARIQKAEERVKTTAEATAKTVLAVAIQRQAAGHTAEATVSTVDLPSDEMKGRIIGREGRNIRAFEKATGVDVVVDDTPGVVIVSAFDPVRREVARLALAKLIADGRIHPSRIEEVVQQTQSELDAHVLTTGQSAVAEAGCGPVAEKLCQLLGRLKYRTSYSQNVLRHSVEVAHLCGCLAEELGLDGTLARRCGLLHDVGKAADHEMEGGHPKVGAELAKRYGESRPEVLHAIAGHHDDVTADHVYTVLVAAADAISASRPGARREALEKYVKRLEALESLALGFPGVEQAYAIQAGREVRVIANAERLSDAEAVTVCRGIAKAIEERLEYPGEVKVTVVRETRAVEFAR